MIADVYAVIDVLGLSLVRAGSKEVRVACPAHADRTGKRNSTGDFYINVDSGKSQCFSCGFQSTSILTLGAFVTGRDIWSVMAEYRAAGAVDMSQLPVVGANDSSPHRDPNDEILAKNLETSHISEAELVLFDPVPDVIRDHRHLTEDAIDAYSVRWDSEQKAWVLPLYDHRGYFKGYQLRNKGWEKNQPTGLAKAQLLFGAPLHLVEEYDTPIVITESPLDAVRAWQVGFFGLSTLGASFSDEQIQFVLQTDRVVVAAFDQDKTGHNAALRLHREYGRRFGGRLRFCRYVSEHKDIGDMPDDTLVSRTLENTTAVPGLVVAL